MTVGNETVTKQRVRRRDARRGVSLVEMLVSVAAVSLALSLAAGVTYRVLQLERSAREQAEVDEATRALTRQLRTDVHAAREAELVEENRLRLTRFDGLRVEYQWEAAATERGEWRGDELLRRERFRRLRSERLKAAVERHEGQGTWVELTSDELTRTGQLQRRWRFEAALAADRREGRTPRLRGRAERRVRRARGFLLAAALACLFVLSLVCAVVAQRFLVTKRQTRLEQQRAQAALLADAGCRRAIARLQQNGEYTGEMWTVPAGVLGATTERADGAAVELLVRMVEGQPQRRVVTVVARYPTDPVQGVVQRRQFEIEL